MGAKPNPIAQRIMANGQANDRKLIREETFKEAWKLKQAMPTLEPDRSMFVREKVRDALAGKIDVEIFREFARMSNCWEDIRACLPRAVKGRR